MLLASCSATPAWATVERDEVAIVGKLQSQNLVRHPSLWQYHLVQQRTTFWARVDWRPRWRASPARPLARMVRATTATLAYRAAYDSIYDFTPTFRERDLRGRRPSRIAARDLEDLAPGTRDAIKWEHHLRLAYLETTPSLSLRLRFGKQQIAWGEADFLRMLDRANPLDLSWHGGQELPPPAFGWDDLRIPLWMLRLWWTIGDAGPLADLTFEAYWNLGDWRPVRVSFLPRPWGARLLHPLHNREDGAFHAPFTGIRRLANGSRLFRQGSYRRHPGDNSQLGLQLSAAYAGLRIGLYYFYQRWAGDDGTPFAPIRGLDDDERGRILTQRLIAHGTLPAEYVTPYVHTVGMSANYFDPTWTLATYRVETVVDLDLPLFDRRRATTLAPVLPGVSARDYWKGMVAIDRALPIPWISRESPIFLASQLYFHHLIGSVRGLTGPLDLPTAGSRPRPFCGSSPPAPCDDPAGNGSFRDDVHRWELLGTLAMLTFLRAGTLVPVVGVALDPVNSYATNVFWSLDVAWTQAVTVNVTQRFFTSAQDDIQKGPFDPWHIGTQRGRSETGLRVTYAF